ncbi:MAG: Na+/H+ antiporter NhaA [Friedmanniella sp.]|jgi:Na+/H+ antiporter NhaA
MSGAEAPVESGRTAWSWVRDTPLRAFIRTETGSAVLLLVTALLALVWVAVAPASYEQVWTAPLSLRLGAMEISQDLRGWINNGLMTFFFFVIGLEARRSIDIGDLRERSRVLLPLLAGLGGMLTSIGIYLAVNHGGAGASGWGIAMSTDTAFALGLLSLAGAQPLAALRGFMLTVVVVDDVIALLVIAIFYSDRVEAVPLLVAAAVFGVGLLGLRLRVHAGGFYVLVGVGTWLGLYRSGLDPLIVGLAMGLLTYASPVGRDALESATTQFRLFREQPTSEMARAAQVGLRSALPPNDRLQGIFHPWTSYVIVPLFALANAGIAIDAASLAHAVASPIAVGVVVAYVLGKPLGIAVSSVVVSRVSRGRFQPPVGWGSVLGGGASAGIGFTVSLLIATLAFEGLDLEAAKLGILASAAFSAGVTWLVFRLIELLPGQVRSRALFGSLPPLTDLTEPVDPDRDHIRGLVGAPITLLEYGDLECPYCGRAEPAVRELLASSEDVRYAWRHLPLTDVHPHAQLAAEAAEAAGCQDHFWEMHDLLLSHQDALEARHLLGYAEELGLDLPRFRDDVHRHATRTRIAADVESAAASGVVGTPTFFVNGRRHHGAYDVQALLAAVQEARDRPS